MIAAVLFDFDGVLADSEPLQKAAWRRYLARFGRTLEPALIDRMFGLRLTESAALVQQTLGLPVPVAQVMAERDELFLTTVPGALQPRPHAHRAVRLARELGYKTALATSGHRRYIEIALRELDLEHAFDAVVTGDSVARGKPAPDIFERAAGLLDVPPERCVVVEDAPHGIAAARAAGMLAVAVPNEMTEALDFGAADLRLAGLEQFCAWLSQDVQPLGERP